MIARVAAGVLAAEPAGQAPPLARGGEVMDARQAADTLQALRAEIERADAALIAVLAERMALAQRVGACKRAAGLPVLDPAREAAVVARAAAMGRGVGLPEVEVRELWWRVVGMARRGQNNSAR